MDLTCKNLGLFSNLSKKFNILYQPSDLLLKLFEEGKEEFSDRSFSTSIVKKIENQCIEYLRSPKFPKELIDSKKRKKDFEIKF